MLTNINAMATNDKIIVYTRSAYCAKCAAAGRPFPGSMFVLVGGSSQKYKIRLSKVNSPKGFTPHLFIFDEVVVGGENNGMIQVIKSCAHHKCGVWITKVEHPDYQYTVDITESTYSYLTPKEWVALKNVWKGSTGYELD